MAELIFGCLLQDQNISFTEYEQHKNKIIIPAKQKKLIATSNNNIYLLFEYSPK